MPVASICVYCSSSGRTDPAFVQAAEDFGRLLGADGHELVWGGASVGSMGAVARGARAAGGKLYGVMPSAMVDREIAFTDADELVLTATMRQRKELMEMRADAFAVLPGGFGTLEEIFEILTLRQLGYHAKPVGFLEVGRFWAPLFDLFEHLYATGMAKRSFSANYAVFAEPAELLAHLLAAEPAALDDKWS